MREIRCFISSPGDVGQERVVAVRVIERLAGEYSERLQLTPIVWEHEPLRATEHFQSQIIPPSQTDIVICILWSRLGTRLPEQFQRKDGSRFESGTEWEFEDAIESYRQRGTPDLLVYRKTSEAMASLKSKDVLMAQVDQKDALDKFIDRWFGNPTEGFRAAFHNFGSADEFERLLEAHLRRFLEEHVGTTVDLGTGPRRAIWHRGTPFRGLKPFDVEHAQVFYGRTKAIGDLKTQLTRQAAKGPAFLLVIGMSGSGKSSLVRAGLVPTMTVPGVVEGIGLWRWGIVRPNDAPEGLHAMLGLALHQPTALPGLAEMGLSAPQLGQLLESQPQLVVDPIGAALKNLARQVAADEKLASVPTPKILLVIDQLEEVFAQGQYTDGQLRNFAHAVSVLAQSGHVWFVATLRSDYFSQLCRVPEWVGLKAGDGQYDLLPPSISEIEQMIQFPARAAGIAFEIDPQSRIGLDKALLESAAKSPESLPLLEFTLDELYKRRKDDVLTFDAYRQLGGLEGAIAQRAEEVLHGLPAEVQQELPHLFRACVTVSPAADHAVSAIRVPFRLAAATPRSRTLVEAFVEARLLVTDKDSQGTQTIGLAHEALLRHWPRLTNWLTENREFFRIRSQVAVAAETWHGSGRSSDYLLAAGKPLFDGESLLESRDQLAPLILEYVQQSSAAARRKSMLRKLWIAGIVAAFLILISSFAVYSFAQWRRADWLKSVADKERTKAVEQEKIATEQRNIARDREQVAIQKQTEAENARKAEALALEKEKEERAAKTVALEQTELALQKADFNLNFRNPLIADVQWSQNEMTSARSRLLETPTALRSWEWNHAYRKCHQETFSHNLDRVPVCVAISPKGSRLAVSLKDNPAIEGIEAEGIEIWDWIKREKVCELVGAFLFAEDVRFLKTGDQVVSWGGNELLVWNIADQTIARRIEIASPNIGALSPTGEFAALGFEQGTNEEPKYTIEVWDVASGTKRNEWTRDGRLGQAIAIAADGSQVAVAEHYAGIAVLQYEQDDPIFELPEPESTQVHSTIFSIAISDDRRAIAVGKYNGELQVLYLDGSRTTRNLFGHENAIVDVEFPGGSQLISSSWDATVHVWNFDSGEVLSVQRGHEDWVLGTAISASGNTLASISKDTQLKLWDLKREANPTLYFHRASFFVDGIAWTPNSKKWLAAVDDATVISGELATGYTFNDDARGGRFLARSPDGTLFATGGGHESEATVRLYANAKETRFSGSPEAAGELTGHAAQVTCGVFLSPEWLATGSSDGAIKLWDVATHQEKSSLSCPGPILSVTFNPDSQTLYAGDSLGALYAIDVANVQVREVARFNSAVVALALRPKGKVLAIGAGTESDPGAIQLFDTELQRVVGALSGHTGPVRCLDFVPDGSRLASGSDDRSIKIWDVDAQLEALSLWGHQREVTALTFSPNGHKLASGDRMGSIIVWDATPPVPESPAN